MNTAAKSPRLGHKVHFVLNNGPNKGAHRFAFVTGVVDAEAGRVNLQVFSDGTKSCGDFNPNLFYKSGAERDEVNRLPGSWHYPEPGEEVEQN